MLGARVHFAVTQGGGALLDPSPTMTDTSGVATMRWRLGSSGAQRVQAELQDGVGARVQHVGFNADIEAPATAGPGGCSITIGERGDVRFLTSEAIAELLGQFEGRLCLCFLAGDHVIEGLTANGTDSARVSIHGCGPAAVIKLQGPDNIVGFEYFELSDVAIIAEGGGVTFDQCREVIVRNVTVRREDAQDRPHLHFTTVTAVTVEGCSIRAPGLSVIIEPPSELRGPMGLVNNDIGGVTSFFGMPNVDQSFDAFAILQRMNEQVELEATGGEVLLANNRFELLTLGENMMNELNEFAARTIGSLTGLFDGATISGNSIDLG